MSARPFGILPTGESVEAYTLSASSGFSAEVITYGGAVRSLLVPDRHGELADVVLGFDDLAGYLAPHPYTGAIVGRVAGRINGSRFSLDGKTHVLPVNESPNHLHGGYRGFDKQIWTASPSRQPDGSPALRLTYRSPDGEEGYPGTVDVSVTYRIEGGDTFVIECAASTDRATPFSLTYHSYFNLAGHGSVDDHELQIHADHYAPCDERLALLGRREPVGGLPCDFTRPRRVGDAAPLLYKAHGDLYFVRRPTGIKALVAAARFMDPGSGRVLEVSTTEDCLQLYTGSGFDGTHVGKSGQHYHRHAGLCLECEGFPNGANAPWLGDIILRPGQVLRQTTTYRFSTY